MNHILQNPKGLSDYCYFLTNPIGHYNARKILTLFFQRYFRAQNAGHEQSLIFKQLEKA